MHGPGATDMFVELQTPSCILPSRGPGVGLCEGHTAVDWDSATFPMNQEIMSEWCEFCLSVDTALGL